LLLVSISEFSYLYLAFEANKAGFNSILTKPVREENLRSMLLIADGQRKSRTVSPTLIGSPENRNSMDNLM
jgi:hypothetical protein